MRLSREFVLNNVAANVQNFRYLNILSIIYVTFLMAATVMAYKIVNIWGISEPGSTLIYTFTYFLGNIFAELYGPSKTNKLIWQSIISGYIFAVLITFVNTLPSPDYWNLQIEFDKVLGNVLRFTNAGVIGYLLSAFLNAYLITMWKYKLKGRLFWARSLLATSLSEGTATFIAGFITFFGMIPSKSVTILMANAFLFKMIYGLIAVWPASFIAYVLKLREKEITEKPIMNPFIID